jgi:hypothetical protein
MATPRAQAIASGELVPVDPALAAEAGFRYPVALTCAVHQDCVRWTAADTAATGAPQDETGRLWDVLGMARRAIRQAGHSDFTTFQVYRLPRSITRADLLRLEDGDLDEAEDPRPVRLLIQCAPGDDLAPVLTIMQPRQLPPRARPEGR